jgi:hypothetical protein
MRVRSPIGDLPFAVTAIRVEQRQLVIDGELGAWRSQINVAASDIPMLARALKKPMFVAGAVGLAALAVRSRR